MKTLNGVMDIPNKIT